METKIGLPSFSGIKDAAKSYAIGAGGGLLYAISTAVTGSGLIGGLAGAAIAGSMIKGVKGEIIATMLGFQTGMALLSGGGSADAGSNSNSSVI